MFWIHDLWLQKGSSLSTNREQNCLKSNKTDTILALVFHKSCRHGDVFLNNAAAPCAPSLMPTRFPFKWRLLQRNVSSLHVQLLFFSLKSHLPKGQWVEPCHLKGPLKRVLFWLKLNLNYLGGKLGEKACIRLCKDSFITLDRDLLKRDNFFW